MQGPCWASVWVGAVLTGSAVASDVPATRPVPVAELIGVRAAQRRLNEAVPIGRGIIVGHVEGEAGQYLPNHLQVRFQKVRFIPRSGPSTPFGHATSTARVIYGRGGLAPGVEEVHCYASGDWLTRGYLFANPAGPPPSEPIRVFTHSWIGGDRKGVEHLLRRVDYDVDVKDVLYCVGVNNKRNSAVPPLLGSAHNVIAVGTAGGSGASSGGYTRYEGAGRCKPDIVGPRGLTSFTTPAVAACVVRLLETADALGGAAPKPEVIKAVLLAGAEKPPLWKPREGSPLDEHLGAGVAHLDNSLQILEVGEWGADDSTTSRCCGWGLWTMNQGSASSIRFQTERSLGPASFVLAWNRRIAGRVTQVVGTKQQVWLDTPRLADFDLLLFYRAADADADTPEHLVALSDSEVDNVEHIYFPALPAGRYRLEVRRLRDGHAQPWEVAWAFRVSGSVACP